MPYSICLIDDGLRIPAQALELENMRYFSIGTTIQMLNQDWGVENSLKELCRELTSQTNEAGQTKWKFRGFSNPDFFDDAFDNDNFRPNLIVFDWEYSNTTEFVQTDFLRGVLERSHARISIFSGADKIEEIHKAIDESLSDLVDRIDILDKDNGGEGNHAALLTSIEEHISSNFSFKFGHQLRQVVNGSLDRILLKLGELKFEQVLAVLGESGSSEFSSDFKEMLGAKSKEALVASTQMQTWLSESGLEPKKADELIEFISEKISNDIQSSTLAHSPIEADGTQHTDINIQKELWSYRMFHQNSDGRVRTGDIFRTTNEGAATTYHFVINDPCSLEGFWQATGGVLNSVQLLDLDADADEIREISGKIKNNTQLRNGIGSKVSSLTNRRATEALGGRPILVPNTPVDGTEISFLLYPNCIFSESIDLPARISDVDKGNLRRNLPGKLTYADMTNCEYIASVSAPFKNSLIGTIVENLFGWGVGDYSDGLKSHFGTQVKGLFG